MKKSRRLCLILCILLLVQAAAVFAQADETETTQATTVPDVTEPSINLDDIHIPAGQDASIVNGCRTLDGKMPLWGTAQLMPTSGAIMFYEVNSDTVVYSWYPDERMEPASLVKIMTCLIAVENADIKDQITVTSSALGTLSEIYHTLGLKPGEQVTLEQMLYSMMVGSANDASVVIAEHVAGSVAQFVSLMNQRAIEIGCNDTNFTDPTGLGYTEQYTTARDMAKIVNEAIKNELFCEFFSATLYNLPATNLSESRRMETSNYLMTPGMIAFYEEEVTGGRTGITADRKRCLASTAEHGSLKYITIILGAEPLLNASGTKVTRFGNYEDTQDLLKMGFKDHHIVQVFRENQIINQYKVTNGASDVSVGPDHPVITVLPSEVTVEDLTVRYVQSTHSITAPVTAGDRIDTVQLWYKNVCIAQSELTAKNSVAEYIVAEKDDSAIANTEGISKALIIIGIILAFVLCVAGAFYVIQSVRMAVKRAQHRRRRKNRRRSR